MTEIKQKKIKGIFQPEIPLEELEKKQVIISLSLPERRSVRYRCMRIRNKNWNENDGLKEMIEKQFERDMNWGNYLEVWDIDKIDSYKIVRK